MRRLLPFALAAAILGGCATATIDVTKTSKGVYASTNPNEVEILTVVPKDRQFIELATVSTTGWKPSDTATMHNALRSKSAPIGADAVILVSSGIVTSGAGLSETQHLWATGTAIRYTDHK